MQPESLRRPHLDAAKAALADGEIIQAKKRGSSLSAIDALTLALSA